MTRHLINKAVMTQNCLEALNQNAQLLEKKAAVSNFIIIIFLTPVLKSRGMKKLRYAIQNGRYSSIHPLPLRPFERVHLLAAAAGPTYRGFLVSLDAVHNV